MVLPLSNTLTILLGDIYNEIEFFSLWGEEGDGSGSKSRQQ